MRTTISDVRYVPNRYLEQETMASLRELPPEGQVAWDRLHELFAQGDAVAWRLPGGREDRDVIVRFQIFGGRIYAQMARGRLVVWAPDVGAAELSHARGPTWRAPGQRTTVAGDIVQFVEARLPLDPAVKYLRQTVKRDPMFWAKYEEAKRVFRPGSTWVAGSDLGWTLPVQEVVIVDTRRRYDFSTRYTCKPNDPNRYVVALWTRDDKLISLWPGTIPDMMLHPEMTDPPDWPPGQTSRSNPRKSTVSRRRSRVTARRNNSALPLSVIERWIPAMEQQGVSEVARSPRGFLAAYRRAGGRIEALPSAWRQKRENFIARHMAQVEKRGEALYVGGEPTRRHLTLVAWAYSPDLRFNLRKGHAR